MNNKNQQTPWNRKAPLFFLLFIAGFFLMIGAVMYLWNAILPDVTGVTPINYWQAAGIFVLSKILFGGFGKGRGIKNKYWQQSSQLKSNFMNMTEEEKETFKNEWRQRCQK